ncbi:hypothetical protein [Palleronia caenipelagi]|uniref:DUF2059 domain-containing protein n=1 Tax=Palleronia caenipelagi TaxID=2489174 RepID=A0A547Q694_9RHOB|nr:hypothetical protein [Palleronia caenipelagi]TRD21880.1 hypothetical protein FEV53_07465 [Palleronia caenipelagi]
MRFDGLMVAAIWGLCAAPGVASEESDTLYDLLRIDDVITQLRAEGLAYGEVIEEDLFPGISSDGWSASVSEIYDAEFFGSEIRDSFARGLDNANLAPLITFFGSEEGQEIISLELSAREVMADESAQTTAYEMFQGLPGERFDQIDRFAEVNDLIEQNVTGTLNSNLAFYTALFDKGALPGVTSEEDLIRDSYAQIDMIRDEARRWIYGFLTMAYSPLSDETLETYIAVSESEAGQALNAVLFEGFDAVYLEVSRQLGDAAAERMQGQSL